MERALKCALSTRGLDLKCTTLVQCAWGLLTIAVTNLVAASAIGGLMCFRGTTDGFASLSNADNSQPEVPTIFVVHKPAILLALKSSLFIAHLAHTVMLYNGAITRRSLNLC
ncbi:hypothetical protein EVAR_99193_1 [Eumeta japonica]|uniref:Uncharacterized protein n=1 Tax=Eumeta variegata TaxID=151549 RepID=A0A4C1YU37_EUMVA|nr:hypothetical protein EVAR_99193_1 [Eumeta japonica]